MMFSEEEQISISDYIASVQQYKFISSKVIGYVDYSKESKELNESSQKYLDWLFKGKTSKYVAKNVLDLSIDIDDLTMYDLFERYVLLKQMDLSFYDLSIKNYKSDSYSKPPIINSSDVDKYLYYHSKMFIGIREKIVRYLIK